MRASLVDQIVSLLPQAADLYYQLIVVVAPSGKGKTLVLHEVAQQSGGTYINVGLELSRRLVELTARERVQKAQLLLRDIVGKHASLVLTHRRAAHVVYSPPQPKSDQSDFGHIY